METYVYLILINNRLTCQRPERPSASTNRAADTHNTKSHSTRRARIQCSLRVREDTIANKKVSVVKPNPSFTKK